ncbi:hypothetical protein BRADI_2g55292v3 [Brachypodium distachyon]|uniref:Uncharacterized protein n=1 Tax=Brachypodium distachyon TaxID=15368 RepID=A0A2K2DG09_BRADI|nr:hypothetical protein BRADI_2g55292v3 [Brachypodium distachyon]
MLLCGCALQFFPPPPRRRRPHPPRSATAANLAEARPVFGTADIKVYRSLELLALGCSSSNIHVQFRRLGHLTLLYMDCLISVDMIVQPKT